MDSVERRIMENETPVILYLILRRLGSKHVLPVLLTCLVPGLYGSKP
jgi:hypothetical protein